MSGNKVWKKELTKEIRAFKPRMYRIEEILSRPYVKDELGQIDTWFLG